MRIAVNAIFLFSNDQLEGYGHYVKEIFVRLTEQHREHEFVFVFDRPFDENIITGPNVKHILVKPSARHVAAFKYWYDVKAPLALRSLKPDVWIQPYGFCSLTTKIPQLLVMHDLAFLHYQQFISWQQRLYYKWFTPLFVRKAARVITVSNFSKEDIVRQYKSPPEKIAVVHGAARQVFQPLSWQEKETVKEAYSDGREYFLFVGGVHPRKNLLNLLKAFSLFKKWQHSNMKLLVAGRLAWKYDDVLEKLKTYKYREDVVLLSYLPEQELAGITAAAYALVYPSFFEGFGLPVLEAMQCEVPVITSNNSSMPEIGGDAAVYIDPNNPDAIAKEMLVLYRNEALRSQFIRAGKERVSLFNWNKAANEFWEQIMKTNR